MKRTAAFLPVFLTLLWLAGCSENQNFRQYEDLSVTPTLEASMLYIEVPERIINQVSAINFVQQTYNFDAFAENFVASHVLDGVITYNLENTTSKPLDIVVEFLDAGDNVLDAESFSLDPAPTAVLMREVAYGGMGNRSIDIIRNTSGIRVSATNLGDNNSVSALPDPKVIFRSSAKFRMQLR